MKFLCFWDNIDKHFSDLLKKGGLSLIVKVIGAILTFALTVYLARILGAMSYGIFMLALTVMTVISTVVRAGLDIVTLKNIAAAIAMNNLPLARGYCLSSVRLVVIIGLVISALLFIGFNSVVISVFNKPELEWPLAIMTWSLIPFSIILVLAEALKGLRFVLWAIVFQSGLVPALSLLIFFIGSYWVNWSLNNVVTVYVGSTFFTAFYAWFYWKSSVSGGEVHLVSSSRLLKEGFPLLLMSAGGLILVWTDILVLGVFESAEKIGVYSVSSRTAYITSLLLFAVNSIVAPKFSAFFASKNFEELARLAQQSTLLMIALVLVPTFILVLFSEVVLQIFGTEYINGSNILIILSIGQLINVSCGPVGYFLMMTGHEKNTRNIALIAAFINVVLSVLFVQLFGAVGVAAATAISTLVWNLWMVIIVRKHFGFWMFGIPTNKIII